MVSTAVLNAVDGTTADTSPARPTHWEIQTAPTMEPVSVDQVRLWLRQSETDSTIEDVDHHIIKHVCIPGARRAIERYLSQSLITQTWDAYFDAADIRDRLWLGKGPLQSITSIISTNDSGTESTQTATTYYALTGLRSEVALYDGNTWATSPRAFDSYRVRFVAGYGASAIGTPNFQGSGSNGTGDDLLTVGGTYTGSKDITLRVMMDAATTWKYSTDGGVTFRETTSAITAADTYMLVEMGVYISFPATSGYTATTDYWDISLTGHGIPEHIITAVKMLAAHIYLSRAGYGRADISDNLERGVLPPAIRAILGPRMLI